MEHLLLCVTLSTGIALVSLNLSLMQFPIVGFHRSRLVLRFLCRLGVYFQVITEICDKLSSIGSVAEVQLLSFSGYVFTPSESSVEMYTQVFYFVRLR
jgi:hypothetical protein